MPFQTVPRQDPPLCCSRKPLTTTTVLSSTVASKIEIEMTTTKEINEDEEELESGEENDGEQGRKHSLRK